MIVVIQQAAENQQASWIFFAVAFIFFVVFFGLILSVAIVFVRPWMRAALSGVPVSAIQLVGMYLRRSPVRKIIDCGIMAAHGGHGVPWADLEHAALQKVDLDLVTTAWIQNKNDNLGLTWEQLVDSARHSRLDKLLGSSRPT